mmetsp:Transcript_1091/g.1537  ORF Transcript_1091/g.1537 Transcript_1091/m.1537 type:complete len:107 (-) Transcript_1091:423-743(-)|eukprot:CAMPEP_0196595532 /NCGR_PEP_ID=MMETSP1081-20130531/81338_1 /TAXON_ID=36882 /ORGANISM="Pyramimonas amylifera, Strain CCMP720" /LENGTH=106 /DNA_ID=CAMNT_0041920141 /DNA_START=163 /DNA_END=483 /DNA_ORIENTATION=+
MIITESGVSFSSGVGSPVGFGIQQRFIAAVLFVFSTAATQTSADASANCLDLGFTGMQLCSDCDALAEFVKDEGLVSECKQCCAKESKRSANKDIKFTSATLEVCS